MFEWQQIVDEPDRCAYRLIRRIHEAFGYDDEQIPREFDPETGRLSLPG